MHRFSKDVANEVRRWMREMLCLIGKEAHSNAVAERTLAEMDAASSSESLPRPDALAHGPGAAAVAAVLGDAYVPVFLRAVKQAYGTPRPFPAVAGGRQVPGDGPSLDDVVREALSAVATPVEAERLTGEALARAKLDALPTEIEAFVTFVWDALYPLVASTHGRVASDTVRAYLQPIIERARTESGLHRQRLKSRPRMQAHSRSILVGGTTPGMRAIARALGARGDRVAVVANGPEILQYCNRSRPRLIVCESGELGIGDTHLGVLLHRVHGKRSAPLLIVGPPPATDSHRSARIEALAANADHAAVLRAIDALVDGEG